VSKLLPFTPAKNLTGDRSVNIFEIIMVIWLGRLIGGVPGLLIGLSGRRGPPDRLSALANDVLVRRLWKVRHVSPLVENTGMGNRSARLRTAVDFISYGKKRISRKGNSSGEQARPHF
jgi:hypothetical protein